MRIIWGWGDREEVMHAGDVDEIMWILRGCVVSKEERGGLE